MSCCVVLYCVVLCCIVLYCILLCCVVLYCIVVQPFCYSNTFFHHLYFLFLFFFLFHSFSLFFFFFLLSPFFHYFFLFFFFFFPIHPFFLRLTLCTPLPPLFHFAAEVWVSDTEKKQSSSKRPHWQWWTWDHITMRCE